MVKIFNSKLVSVKSKIQQNQKKLQSYNMMIIIIYCYQGSSLTITKFYCESILQNILKKSCFSLLLF